MRLALAMLVCAAQLASAETERFIVDPDATRVRIHLGRAGLLKFLGHDHVIEAPVAEGWIDVDPTDPTRSVVDLHWNAPLLAIVPGTEPDEDILEVEEKMRGLTVLDVEQHPRVRFWSVAIVVEEADPTLGFWRLHVRGGLELKGARHTVEVGLEVRVEGDELTASGEVELQLRRIGIEPPSVAGVVKVSNRFRISFEVKARRARPEA